jgi:hypothetical protein
MSDKDVREWALANGRSVPARGPLSAEIRAEYAEQSGGNTPELEPTDADFPDFAEAAPPPPDTEVRPRTIAVPKKPRFGFGKQAPAGKKKTPAKKRVPVDDTIATVWRFLGSLAKPLPATSRLMKFQAPAVGKILEPVVRDTVVDRLLQPIARTTEGAEAVAVLFGAPALVTAMQLQPQIIPFALPALRELLVRMVRVAGPAMAESLATERKFEAEYGGTVDDLIAMLFAGLFEEGAEPMTAEDEEAAIRRAQEAVENVAAA